MTVEPNAIRQALAKYYGLPENPRGPQVWAQAPDGRWFQIANLKYGFSGHFMVETLRGCWFDPIAWEIRDNALDSQSA